MKKSLLALNSIKKSGVIDDYAIGGAIAASFYMAMSQLNSGGHASHMDTGVDVQYVKQ